MPSGARGEQRRRQVSSRAGVDQVAAHGPGAAHGRAREAPSHPTQRREVAFEGLVGTGKGRGHRETDDALLIRRQGVGYVGEAEEDGGGEQVLAEVAAGALDPAEAQRLLVDL